MSTDRPRQGKGRRWRRAVGGGTVVSMAMLAVVVVAWRATRTDTTPVPKCTGAQSLDFDCFVARYEALTRASGVAAALADLDAQRTTNGYVVAACHQLTHVIGRTAGQLHGEAAFMQGSDLC